MVKISGFFVIDRDRGTLEDDLCAAVEELSQALIPEFAEFLDLRRIIQDVYGQFIIIDNNSRVGMVHQTASEYLSKTSNLQFSFDLKEGHRELLAKIMAPFFDSMLRYKLVRSQQGVQSRVPFISYVATSWLFHLRQVSATSEDIDMLLEFFRGPCDHAWIHTLALFGQLEKAAQVLTSFVSLHRKLNAEKNPLLLQDLERLDLWAIDLVKILRKFGEQLLQDLKAIYKIVPP